MISLLHPPLLRDPRRSRPGALAATGMAARVLDVGGVAAGAVRAGVDAALARASRNVAFPRAGASSARPQAAVAARHTTSRLAASPDGTALIYELLDAPYDTGQLADELAVDPCWETNLDYLRALQRKGREALAHGGWEGKQ